MTAAILLLAAAQAQQPVPLSYGENRMHKIDLWLAQSDEPTPLVVFIHGGGFRGGSYKQASQADVQYCLQRGVSFASVEYRLTDQGPYPMQFNDCARAIQCLRANAGKYNIAKGSIAAYGGSAGACISMWLAFHDDMADPKSADPIARESTRLKAAGSQNGQPTLDPRTFEQWFGVGKLQVHPALLFLFGVKTEAELEKPEVRKLITDASPITHLTKDDPPVMLVNGQGDVVQGVPDPNQIVHHARLGIKLKEQMDKLGIECHTLYPGGPQTKYRSLMEFLLAKLKT
jgi:acetyl esterase/lipase